MKTQDSQSNWEQLELFPLPIRPYDVPLITPVVKENNDQTRKN